MPWTSQSTPPVFSGDALGFIVEDGDEFGADAFALGFGVGDSGELFEKALAGIDSDDVEAEFVAEVFLDALEFIFAEDAVIDEDAGELVPMAL